MLKHVARLLLSPPDVWIVCDIASATSPVWLSLSVSIVPYCFGKFKICAIYKTHIVNKDLQDYICSLFDMFLHPSAVRTRLG